MPELGRSGTRFKTLSEAKNVARLLPGSSNVRIHVVQLKNDEG